MMLRINGTVQELPAGIDGRQLLDLIDWTAATLVAEVNGELLRKDAFLERPLFEGDEIELVTLVGGG